MAPICPEEVDVFTIPHSRMKELVEQYLDLMTSTNFSNEVHLTHLLENLCKTFREFIAHEQIENRYIMKKLKNKLHSLSIQNNAVCNCHKDNQLTDMLTLLQDGYKCTKKSEADRKNYGIKLGQALEQFTKTFIPHMEEEEEVFQPLLMQYFSIEELKQIKAKVIEQHLKVEADETPEKFVHDNRSDKCIGRKSQHQTESETVSTFDQLPDEVVLKIFHSLNPQQLCRAAQVSTRWRRLSLDDSLWTKLLPVSWAKGDWDANEGVYEEDQEDSVDKKLEQKLMDEDADVDESRNNESWDDTDIFAKQSKMLVSMCKHLLPKVGQSIKYCDLAYSKGLTNGTLYKILSLCPNLEHLDLTQTHISDLGFKGLQKGCCGSKLRHLDLTGCLYITDKTLARLAAATAPQDEEDEEEEEDQHIHDSHSNTDEKYEALNCSENDKQSLPQTCLNLEKNMIPRPCCKNTKMKESCCSESRSIVKACCNVDDGKRQGNPTVEHLDVALTDYTTEPELNVCCDVAKYCDRDCVLDKDLPINVASSTCGDTLSRLRCCQRSMANGSYFWDKDIETSAVTPQCCKRARHTSCCKNGNRNAGHTQQQDSKQPTNYNVPTKNERSCVNHTSQTCFKPPDTSQNNSDSECLTERVDDRTKCNVEPTLCCTEVEISSMDDSQEDRVVEGEKDDGDEMEIKEILIELSSIIEEQNQLNTEVGDNVVMTWIPELYIVPVQNVDCDIDTTGSGVQTVPNSESALQTGDINNMRSCNQSITGRRLEFLCLSGCFQITDDGLQYLCEDGGLPNLRHLDLSGCLNLSGEAVSQLVSTAGSLNPALLFYCDNILDGPYTDTASGCQNLQCATRACCRVGE